MVKNVVFACAVTVAGRDAFRRIVELVERVAFWIAVVVPVLYVPVFVLIGADWIPMWTLVPLIGVNITALAIGYRYDPQAIRDSGATRHVHGHDTR